MKLALSIGGDDAKQMLRRQLRSGDPITSLTLGDRATIAAIAPLLQQATNGNLLVTIGTPLHPIGIDALPDVRSACEHLPSQDGAFASIFWSAAERRLVIVSDFLGFKPLFLRRVPGGLEVAGTTKAWRVPPDLAGWGAFISFGHTIGKRSLAAGVRRVPAATILIYEPDRDVVIERQYWHWPQATRTPDYGGLVAALRASVEAYANAYGPGTLLLSGGFDSRLIAFLLQAADIPATALCVSHRDELLDADGRVAAALAGQLGMLFSMHDSSPDFFSSRGYLNYLFENDAATPSLYLFIARVASHLAGASVWEGTIPGPTLKAAHQPPGGFGPYLQQECRAADSAIWTHARLIFGQERAQQMLAGFSTDLREEIECYPDTEEGVAQFVIRNRARNRTGQNPLQVYEANGRAFLPGMTRDYFDLAGTIPHASRHGDALYFRIFEQFFPGALRLPIVSGGTLIRTSPTSLSYHLNRLRGQAAALGASYPRIFDRLGWNPMAQHPQASSFVACDKILLDDEDPWLDHAAIRSAIERDRFSDGARKLLMHWRVWRLLHEGQLFHRFEPFVVKKPDVRFSRIPESA